MSEKNTSWYHCGRCGTMFRSVIKDMPDRNCSACGRSPSLAMDALPWEPSILADPTATHVAELPLPERERQHARKSKHEYLIAKLVVGWLLFLVVIIFAARQLWNKEIVRTDPIIAETPAQSEAAVEDFTLLNEARNPCYQALVGFLRSTTPEHRSQFVHNPTALAGRMIRFYSLNSLANIDDLTLTLDDSAVIHFSGSRAIETQWSSATGHSLDAVFIQKNGEWRLDWEHYTRYGDHPWPLFLAGSGEELGEFRLLARERLAVERKDAETISIVLYAPRYGYSRDTGRQSPEFLIQRNTPSGKLLDAAFQLERSGQLPFGAKLKRIDPEGHIRVRVKVRRIIENKEQRFEVDQVTACHWYSNPAAGVEITEPKAK